MALQQFNRHKHGEIAGLEHGEHAPSDMKGQKPIHQLQHVVQEDIVKVSAGHTLSDSHQMVNWDVTMIIVMGHMINQSEPHLDHSKWDGVLAAGLD